MMEKIHLEKLGKLIEQLEVKERFFPLIEGHLAELIKAPEIKYGKGFDDLEVELTPFGKQYLNLHKPSKPEGAHYVFTILSLLRKNKRMRVKEIAAKLKYAFKYSIYHALERMANEGKEEECPYAGRLDCVKFVEPLIKIKSEEAQCKVEPIDK
jgi:hypothetical protein